MATIEIDLPDEARDALAQRADARGLTLQAYLRAVLLRQVPAGTNDAVLDEVASWRAGSAATGQDVLDALTDARRGRPGGAA
jgi:putative heme iron utilization protein